MSADPATMDDPMFEDEQYDSAEDEDFQLDDAQDEGDITSSEDEQQPASKRRKRDAQDADLEAAALDSGDEITIQKAKSKKQKKQRGKKSKDSGAADEDDEDEVDFDDEEGGPAGFVRTRAMKMRMFVAFLSGLLDWY